MSERRPLHVCPYCEKPAGTEKTSDEHVWPQGLGGNLGRDHDLVLPGVHERCNKLLGRHVDGPFIRSAMFRLTRRRHSGKPGCV